MSQEILTADQIRKIIRERKQALGTVAVAKFFSVSESYITLLLNGNREPSNNIARKLGYEAIRVFRKAESSEKRHNNG
jgi:hypothetical protein